MITGASGGVGGAIARRLGHEAWVGGRVMREGGRKAVEITPLGITFEAETLKVR